MTRRLLYILVILSLGITAAAVDDAGTSSPFTIGSGARELGLGGAAVADCFDAYAPYWNPSGLALAENLSITGYHSRLYDESAAYQYFGLAYPTLDWGGFGLGLFRLGVDGIERRDNNNLMDGEFSDTRFGLYIAYGHMIGDFAIGASMTFEQHSIDTYKESTSPGINLSASKKFDFNNRIFKSLVSSLNLRNLVQPSIKLADEKVKYPQSLDWGIAIDMVPSAKWDSHLKLLASIEKTDQVDPGVRLGLEYSVMGALSLRVGMNDGKTALGAGINYKYFAFDYAVVDRDMGTLHMFNLSTSLGRSVSERRRDRSLKREAELNELMRKQMENRNDVMVQRLKKEGTDLFEAGKYKESINKFDKALFIARQSVLDTLSLREWLAKAEDRLNHLELEANYTAFIDSAQNKFDTRDYLASQYYAGLALKIKPESSEAIGLLNRSTIILDEMSSRDKLIDEKLTLFDSLVSYGYLDQAETVIGSIENYAKEDSRIGAANRKIKFELLKNRAIAAYDMKAYGKVIAIADSALMIYPGHRQCLDLKAQAAAALKPVDKKPAVVTTTTSKRQPLDSKILEEVEKSYGRANELFKNGQLEQAMVLWQEVERIAPDYKSVREFLIKTYKYVGVELYGQNKLKEAIEIWRKAADLDPNNEEINSYIQRSESELKKLQELSYDRQ